VAPLDDHLLTAAAAPCKTADSFGVEGPIVRPENVQLLPERRWPLALEALSTSSREAHSVLISVAVSIKPS
jgi:hypothetical protein